MTTRTVAQGQHERRIAIVVELDIDSCSLQFGVAPCTATPSTGNECYNTFATCPAAAKASFVRTTVTKKFCSRGVAVPGETVRPYVASGASTTPTEIVPSKGLAMRSQTTIALADEPCPDHLEDPYFATRPVPAGGTFWTRLMARNNNLVGRVARVRQGYVTSPWDWTVFQTSTFVIDAMRGPDSSGKMSLVLSDVLKIADRNNVPAATAGTLQADIAAIANTGFALAASSNTIALAAAASAIDSAYNGFEVAIVAGLGTGQKLVVSSYVGATREATLTTSWSVVPDGTSVYQVSALSINVGDGKGAQYADPATSGKLEYIRIGDEIIRYSAKSGDVLSWVDSSYRAQWGTTAADHKVKDAVQLCRAWIAKRPWEVLRDIFVESGISLSYLDTTGWQVEDGNWWNTGEITAIVSEVNKASDLAAELLRDLGAVAWWDPVAALVKVLANQPILGAPTVALTDSNFIGGTTQVERQDQDRLTSAALFYGIRVATANRTEARNYLAASIYVDTDAQSANEYADTRATTGYSRFLSAANGIFAQGVVARRVGRLRDAPQRFTFKLDPKDEVQLGQLVSVNTRRFNDFTGQPKTVNARVVRLADKGANFEVAALTTGFKRSRYGFIAPNSQPDYTAASAAQRNYGYISTTATGRMSNGDDGYFIS